jgi:diguanylate cyclase (GGDEF)-like protein/PAS domain S-box-containing protein
MSDSLLPLSDSPDPQQQRELRLALLDSGSLFRCIFDAVDHGILVVDAKSGALLLANPALCSMLGHAPEALLALQLTQLQALGARTSLQQHLDDAARDKSKKLRLSLLCEDGSELQVELVSRALVVQGRALLVALFRDLSDSERAAQAEERARHDELTTLYNHRAFQESLALELARAQRYGTPVSLLMIDIDHFKQINDAIGHQAGDAVLRQLGSLLLDGARNIDQVCRYGGEEFTLILPMTTTTEALHVAGRLRSLIQDHEFAVGVGQSGQMDYRRLTVSIGVASYPLHAQTQAALIAAADTAMYAAKQAGRNCCCVFDPAASILR